MSSRTSGWRGQGEDLEGQWLVLSHLLYETVDQLTDHNYTKIGSIVDELLSTHNLTVAKTSPAYKKLSRSILAAQQEAFRIEMGRLDGDYTRGAGNGGAGHPALGWGSLLVAVGLQPWKRRDHKHERMVNSTFWLIMIAVGAVVVAVANIQYTRVREDELRQELAKQALSLLRPELLRNQKTLDDFRKNIPQSAIPFRSFDTTAWKTVAGSSMLLGLPEENFRNGSKHII
jgi:hypothetical protein